MWQLMKLIYIIIYIGIMLRNKFVKALKKCIKKGQMMTVLKNNNRERSEFFNNEKVMFQKITGRWHCHI